MFVAVSRGLVLFTILFFFDGEKCFMWLLSLGDIFIAVRVQISPNALEHVLLKLRKRRITLLGSGISLVLDY